MKKLSKHLPHYFSLFGILLLSVFGFYLFNYEPEFQMAIIVAAGVAYVVWGIVHHKVHDDLTFSIMVEYLVFSLLGIIIVASIIMV